MTVLKIYAVTFVSIVVLDFVWLGFVVNKFFLEQLRPIGRIVDDKFQVVMWAAVVVYAVLSVAIVEFALPKVQSDSGWLATFGIGALLGFLLYATYDFTNYATLKDWKIPFMVVDIAWGAVLGGLVTMAARYAREM